MNMYGMSDAAIVHEISSRLKLKRLAKNITQQQLATKTGLNRATISDMEHGNSFSILTLVQVLRALDSLDELNQFLPEPPPSPLFLAEMKGKERKRASSKRKAEPPRGVSTW